METMQTSLQYIVHLSDPTIESDTSVPQPASFQPLPLSPTTTRVVEKDSPSPPSTAVGADRTGTAQKRKHSRPAATYPRKRATQACHTCRFRRTKCDNARPACASCVRLGAECIYQQIDASTFDPASLAILKRLDDLEGLIQAKVTDALPISLSTSLECISPSAPHSDLGSCVIEQQRAQWKRSFINIEAVLKWSVFEDHDLHQLYYPINALEDDKSYLSDSNALPIAVDIDFPGANTLLRNFFDHVHIFNPILEEEEVMEYVKIVRFNGIGWDAMSCLLLLIYAHGSITTAFFNDTVGIPPSMFRQSAAFRQAESYFLAAQKRMGMLLCRSGVIEAQCFFLAGVYLMTTMRPVEAWKMFLQALACCQGFSIQQKTNSPGSENEWNPKRRIYWTCFKSELELRLELNLSQTGVWDLTYPTFFPSPPEGLKTKDEAAWYFYLAEIALRRLGNRVLSVLHRSEMATVSDLEYAILDFEEQIDTWLRSLPETLSLDFSSSDGEQQHDSLRFILNGHYLDCQEIMYWHFVFDAVHGRMHGSNGEFFLRKGLKVCVERIQQNRKGFFHRHHGTWLMLRSCSRSAFVLLAAVRRPELVSFLPMGWEEAVVDVTRMLAFWKDESRDIRDMLGILEMLLDTRGS